MSNKQQHTPGPWGPMADGGATENEAWTPKQGALESAPGITIGSVHHTEPICRVSGYFLPLLPNARLIASAPELLKALRYYAELFKPGSGDSDWVEYGNAARAALPD